MMSRKDHDRIRIDAELGGVENKGFEQDPEHLENHPHPRSNSVLSKNSTKDGEVVDRQSWDNPIEFLLSCISMSVGLGNIWRFPFTAYKNGGGAFLIPYIIVLVFIGRPIYFLEMALGQFASFGPVKIWACTPFFKGIGYIGALAGVVTLSYYCSIIATTVYYFIVSFQSTLPWAVCNDDWDDCINCEVSNCPQLYYNRVVTMQKLGGIDDGIGWPLWKLTACLAFAWVFIFFSLVKGVQSSGKVAYFTAIFPYIVLFTFLIRGVTLEGSWKGIEYFITPQWEMIYQPSVWYAAVGQCFFSLGTGTGTITMFASYNPFRHTAYRDALIISLMDTFTSLLAGVTIFAVLGHLSHITNVDIDKVTEGGPGLVFVSYPSAISKFDWAPQLFSVLFFLMLFTLGIGSANALAGAPITILCDQFPSVKKWQMTLGCCILGFLSGLMYVTPGGQHMVTFMDYYGAGFLLYFLCMMEVIAVAWFYGLYKFIRDIEFMLGVKVGWYWIICWGTFIPVGLAAVLVYTFATAEPLVQNGMEYPTVATAIGWSLAGIAALLLPTIGLHSVAHTKGRGFAERFKRSFAPKPYWGPRATHFRKGWNFFKTLGEMKFDFPVSDTENINFYIRGLKERLLITPESNSVTIRIYNLSSDAEVDHRPNATGITKRIHNFLNKNRHTWIITEKSFESFRVTAHSGKKVITHVHGQQMYNRDYVITVKFL